MGLFGKLNKAANNAVRDVLTKQKPAPEVVGERIEGNTRTVTMDDGSEIEWKTSEILRAVFNLDAEKAPSFTSERVEIAGGILQPTEDKERPTLAYVNDGVKLFEISPRMKAYKEVEECKGRTVRKCIAERNEGNYGPYYRMWMYFR